jgi:hypothetical protein
MFGNALPPSVAPLVYMRIESGSLLIGQRLDLSQTARDRLVRRAGFAKRAVTPTMPSAS